MVQMIQKASSLRMGYYAITTSESRLRWEKQSGKTPLNSPDTAGVNLLTKRSLRPLTFVHDRVRQHCNFSLLKLFNGGCFQFPAAAERPVKLHDRQHLVELKSHERIFRRKKQLLLL